MRPGASKVSPSAHRPSAALPEDQHGSRGQASISRGGGHSYVKGTRERVGGGGEERQPADETILAL